MKKTKSTLNIRSITKAVTALILVMLIIIGTVGCAPKSDSMITPDDISSASVDEVSKVKKPTSKKTKTIMVYMVGSDLESAYGAASLDIIEMIESGVNTDNTNLLIFTGGAKSWLITSIPSDKNCIYKLEDEDFVVEKELSLSSMGKSSTLSTFISYCKKEYKADEYGLILWDHGAGPMIGYGVDELHKNDLLTMSEIKTALTDSGINKDNKLEFIGFDACLMGSIETAWILKDYAKYMIASQEVEPGNGWDYTFLKKLNQIDGGKNIGKEIVDSYFAFYNACFKEDPTTKTDITLSCMDLSKISNVEKSLNTLFKKVDSKLSSGYFSDVSKHRKNSKSFGKVFTDYEYDLVDIKHFVSNLSKDYSKEVKSVETSLKDFVCYQKANISNANGVSIYHPYGNDDAQDEWISLFKQAKFAPEYAKYITDFGKKLDEDDKDSWKSFKKTVATSKSANQKSELSIKLTDEQAENFAGGIYYIVKKLNKDEYLFIFGGRDVTLKSDNTLTATYSDKCVYAKNKKTGKYSDTPVTMYEIENGGKEIKYALSSIFWYLGDDIEEFKTDPVEWIIELDNGKLNPLGAYLITDETDKSIPQKQLLNYKDYTSVEFSFSTRTPKRDSSGNLLPYFEWDSTGNFYGNEYMVEDGLSLELRELEDDDDYYFMFVVNDVYGDRFASELFELDL